MNKKAGHSKKDGAYSKFSITLSEDTELFLDFFKQEIRQKSGARVSRSEIIRAAIRYLKTIRPNLSKVMDEKDMLEAIIAAPPKKRR